MRSAFEHDGRKEPDPNRELSLLSEVRRAPKTTQRRLASRLGSSLGLTNLLLRNVARKGYIRVARASWRRRLYALTSTGMIRKAQLTAAYVGRFLGQYHQVKLILREELESLVLHTESRIALYGTGEFAELVYLGLKEFTMEEVNVFGPKNTAGETFLGMLVHGVEALQPEDYDLVIVAEITDTDTICAQLRTLGVASDQLITFFGAGSWQMTEEMVSGVDTHPVER